MCVYESARGARRTSPNQTGSIPTPPICKYKPALHRNQQAAHAQSAGLHRNFSQSRRGGRVLPLSTLFWPLFRCCSANGTDVNFNEESQKLTFCESVLLHSHKMCTDVSKGAQVLWTRTSGRANSAAAKTTKQKERTSFIM